MGLIVTACGGGQTAPGDTSLPRELATSTDFMFATPVGASGGDNAPSSSGTTIVDQVTGLWVTILSPQENSTVNTAQITLVGQAAPGTVITFNDEIVVVDQTGEFSVMLSLTEGPNLIEIVASDMEGNEITGEWIATYDPEQ